MQFTLLFTAFFSYILAAAIHCDVLDLSNFELRPNAFGNGLRDRADKLGEELGANAKATVTKIMNDLNRPADGGNALNGEACNKNGILESKKPAIGRSICFDSGDTSTAQWFPQGVTTVADMQADQQWGDGYQPILVSWYDHNNNAEGGNKGVRISFVDVKTGKYRIVNDKPTYDSVRDSQDPNASGYKTALHAGGIVWYGNFLFVADTARGFRMFDMRRIFDLGASEKGTTSGDDKIGLHDGVYYGYAYRYIMPQTGSWTRTAGTASGKTCSDSNDKAPNFSFVSLDRSGPTHYLVAGEYCNKTRDPSWPSNEVKSKGRVFTWKVSDAFNADGELNTADNFRWRAIDAYKLPESNIQGVTRFNGKWYLSQSNGEDGAGTLFITELVSTTDTILKVASNQPLGFGPEDLSHWPKGEGALGNIWTVGEHKGKRMLYSVIPKN